MWRKSIRTSGSIPSNERIVEGDSAKVNPIGLMVNRGPAGAAKLRERLRTNAAVNAGIFFVVFVFEYAENERLHLRHSTEDSLSDFLRVGIIVLSILQILLIVQSYRDWTCLQAITARLHGTDKPGRTWSAGLAWEVGLHCLLLPPRINYKCVLGLRFDFYVSDYCFLASTLRGYHVLRMLLWMSPLNAWRACFHCTQQRISRRLSFAARWALATQSLVTLSAAWLAAAMLCALWLQTLERSEPHSRFSSLWDSFWAASSLQALNGFGDMVPGTHPGRVVVGMEVLIAIGIIAVGLAVTRQRASMSKRQEALAKELIYQGRKAREIEPAAATVIQRFWRFRAGIHCNSAETEECRAVLAQGIHSFRGLRRALESYRKLNFERDMQEVSTSVQKQVAACRLLLEPLKDKQRIAFYANLQTYSAYKQAIAAFECAKQCRQKYMDLVFGPDYRERRGSTYSQRNSAASISSNLSRLKHLMAQDKYLRVIVGHNSLGNSPRVSLHDLRSVRERPPAE